MTPVVTVTDLRCKLGGVEVLSGVSLTLGAGEVVVVVGPSGSGKSTLVRAIAGVQPCTGGSIRVGAVELGKSALPPGAVGLVFQAFHLFPHRTVLDNVALAPRRVLRRERTVAEAEAMALLARFRVEALAARYPAELSGGQQQRVAIVRALAMQPAVVLFDEPTSALDPDSAAEVLDAVRDVAASGVACLVVTHQMGFARRAADRVVVLDAGTVLEEAPPEQLFEHPRHERSRALLHRWLRY